MTARAPCTGRDGEAIDHLSAPADPADVFLAWLLRLPAGTDEAAAARIEIARLDGASPLSPQAARLRDLFAELERHVAASRSCGRVAGAGVANRAT